MNIPRLSIMLGLMAVTLACSPPRETPPLEGAAIGGPFTLTGEDGRPVSSAAFDGKYRLIYFGYTFCPDVCPNDVQKLMQGLQLFGRQDSGRAASVVPIFITLDPARDTPEVLREWTDAFDPRLVGLTGSDVDIEKVAKQFAVFFKRDAPDANGAYLVDHARMAVLFGPKGEPITLLSQDKDAETIAGELDRWVR